MYRIGIIIYPEVEVLDFCGPYEVFRNASRIIETTAIDVFTVSIDDKIVDAQGLYIKPSYNFNNCPELDLLVIPGGNGRWLMNQKSYQNFVRKHVNTQILTVCTGALLIANMGLLESDRKATTHMEGMELLRQLAPDADIDENIRFSHNGRIITSGGVSAGIDSSLYLVANKWGEENAKKIALYMEYDWNYRKPEQQYNRPDIND